MPRPLMPGTTVVSVRLPATMVARLDQEVAAIRARLPGSNVNRAEIIRSGLTFYLYGQPDQQAAE